jgi:hypothetical protein
MLFAANQNQNGPAPKPSTSSPFMKNANDAEKQQEATQGVLRTYVNDMVFVERDIANALKGQRDDENVQGMPDVQALIQEAAEASQTRHDVLMKCAEALDGEMGAKVKDAVAATTGVLAGIYGKLRKHPVSKMLRDDVTALNLAATCYGMLYTTALSFEEDEIAEVALAHLNTLPQSIMKMTSVMPQVIVEELGKDHTVNAEAAAIAREAIDQAWVSGELSLPA